MGCDFYDLSLAKNRRNRGNYQGPAYGRVKIKFTDNSKKVILAHRLMYMLHKNTLHIPPGKHVSHICHNTLCINPVHLSLEDAQVNNDRKMCKQLVPQVCLKHPGYPDCLFEGKSTILFCCKNVLVSSV